MVATPILDPAGISRGSLPVFPTPGPVPIAPLPSAPRFRPAAGRRARHASPARPLFPDGPALFPWLSRRFHEGEGTLWVGPPGPVEALLRDLFAGVAKAGGRVSLLEGGNRFHPYHVVERGRALEVPPDDLLDRIRLARAFTVYQLVALADGWAKEVRRHRPTLLVAHEPTALFDDPDVDPDERVPLLAAVAEGLRRAAESAKVPLLVASSGGLAGFPGLAERGPRLFDLVKCRPGPGQLVLTSHRIRDRLVLVARPDGQTGLESFGGSPTGEEVSPWDGPYRPTARHWRNG